MLYLYNIQVLQILSLDKIFCSTVTKAMKVLFGSLRFFMRHNSI